MKVQTMVLGPVETNCHILTNDGAPGRALVIDPAYDADAIITELKRRGLKPEAVLLTHTHFDHIEALDALCRATGAPLFCPKKDEPGLRDPLYNASMLFYRAAVTVETPVSRLLSEGDEIVFGNERLRVLETPGHTRGSVCYDTGELLFTGDTLFCGGCGRTDLPGGDNDTLFSSLRRLFALGQRRAYPGHGEETTLQWEKNNYGM